MALAALLAACYLLGTFPTARMVASRWGHDPEAEGSGNPGASNVYRVAGRSAGVVVFVGDVAKGVLAAAAGWAYGSSADYTSADARLAALACGAAAMIGHVAPVWRKGGRGVATTGGAVIVLFPLVAAIALTTWLTLAKVTGRASLASLVTVVVTITGVVLVGAPGVEVAGVVVMSAVVVARHADNIRRLVRGDEPTLDTT